MAGGDLVDTPREGPLGWPLLDGAPTGENREAGENPARSRHCEQPSRCEPGDLPSFRCPRTSEERGAVTDALHGPRLLAWRRGLFRPSPGRSMIALDRNISAPTTKLYLIRHGETAWNRLHLFQGTTDVPLNAEGMRQAEALADRLRGIRLDAAFSSPLQRARATAAAVLHARGITPTVLPELREISYGLWQGRSASPAGRCSPGIEWRWRHDPWTVRFPGGETLSEVDRRAARAIDLIQERACGGSVLVSGHGHLNRVLLLRASGLPRDRFWQVEQANGCCYVIEISPDATTVRQL